MDSIDITHSSYEQTDSIPERGEYNSHRICCSLFVQLISRFFAVEVIPTSASQAIATPTSPPNANNVVTTTRSTSNPSSVVASTHPCQQHVTSNSFVPGQMCNKLDPSCIRTEMYSRIKVFRQTGCDAFFTHLLITEMDKSHINDNTTTQNKGGGDGIGNTYINNQQSYVPHHTQPLLPPYMRSPSSPLTRADKQFMLWTMREVVVSCIEVDSLYAKGILAWLVWMLRGRLSHNKEKMERKYDNHEIRQQQQVPSHRGTSQQSDMKRYAVLVERTTNNSSGASTEEGMIEFSSLAPVPSSPPIINTYLRILIIQELRLFLGGDHWEPILPKQVSAMPSKILLIPWVTDNKRGESFGDGGNDDDSSIGGAREGGKSSWVMRDSSVHNKTDHHQRDPQQASIVLMCNMACRVPVSGTYAASLVVDSGITETLVDMMMGSTCNHQITTKMNSCINPPDQSIHDAASDAATNIQIQDIDLEEWWSILTLLAYVLNTSEEAKDRVEKYIGVDKILKLLLPVAQSGCKYLKSSHKAVVNTILALCVSGASLSPSSRPFIYCSKWGGDRESCDGPPLEHGVSWLFRQYGERKDRESMNALVAGLEETSLSLLSPAYFTDGRSICMMLSTLRPSIVRLENYYKQSGRNISHLCGNKKDSEKRERCSSDNTILHRSQRQVFPSNHANDGSSKLINDQSSVGDVAMSDTDYNEYETKSLGGTRSSYHSLHALGKIYCSVYSFLHC